MSLPVRPMTRCATKPHGLIESLEPRIAPATLPPVTIYVTTLADHEHHGQITLRDAINMANGAGTPAVIGFGSSAKPLHGTITLTSELPSIYNSMTIEGSGVAIDGAGQYRDLSIYQGAAIALYGLKITNGKSRQSYAGAGIYASDAGGTVTITGCAITGNHAVGTAGPRSQGGEEKGAGIVNITGTTLILVDSTVSDNVASGGAGSPGGDRGGDACGGGIFNSGTLTVNHSKITGNTAMGGAGGAGYNYRYLSRVHAPFYATSGGAGGRAEGGGIYSSGRLTVTTSVISGNAAIAGSGKVGGNANHGANGSDFKAVDGLPYAPTDGRNGGTGSAGGAGGTAKGGGIYSITDATLTMSTISGNTITGGSGGAGGHGGNGGNGGKGGHVGTYTYKTAYAGSGGDGGSGGDSGVTAGAGVFASGTLNTSLSTISGNAAVGGQGGLGGIGGTHGSGSGTPTNGMAGTGGTSYAGWGGGIAAMNAGLTLTLDTIAKNSAANGGGIYTDRMNAVTIENNTIAFNKAATGGGLFAGSGNAAINVLSTIIAENSAGTNADVNGTVSASSSMVGGDAMLGSLGYHDGNTLTQTILPSASSPADAGGLSDGFTMDQNGQPFGTGAIYIGAVQTSR